MAEERTTEEEKMHIIEGKNEHINKIYMYIFYNNLHGNSFIQYIVLWYVIFRIFFFFFCMTVTINYDGIHEIYFYELEVKILEYLFYFMMN